MNHWAPLPRHRRVKEKSGRLGRTHLLSTISVSTGYKVVYLCRLHNNYAHTVTWMKHQTPARNLNYKITADYPPEVFPHLTTFLMDGDTALTWLHFSFQNTYLISEAWNDIYRASAMWATSKESYSSIVKRVITDWTNVLLNRGVSVQGV